MGKTKQGQAAADTRDVGEAVDIPKMTVRSVLNVAMTMHGFVAVIYGSAALAHPALLEPFHAIASTFTRG